MTRLAARDLAVTPERTSHLFQSRPTSLSSRTSTGRPDSPFPPSDRQDSLRSISIPIHILTGDADRIVPVGPNAQRLAQLAPRAALTLLPSVAHYTFLAACTDAGRRAQPQLCGDAPDVDRNAIHQRTIDLAAQFFERTLK